MKNWALTGLFAATYVLSFPPYSIFYLAPVSVASLIALSEKGEFTWGFTAGFIGNLLLLYWLIPAITRYGGIDPVSSASLIVLLVGYISLYFGVFSLLLPMVSKGRLSFLTVPSLLTSLEFLRARFLTGFPWGSFGVSLSGNINLLQLASLAGVYGCSFFVALNGLLIHRAFKEKKLFLLLISVVLFVVAAFWGKMRIKKHPPGRFKVALCQLNIDQGVKWDEDYVEKTFSIMKNLIEKAKGSDLVILPETAIPGYIYLNKESYFLHRFKEVAKGKARYIGVGAICDTDYNSFLLFNGDFSNIQRYDKVHLVPFGEFLPLSYKFTFLKGLGIAGSFKEGKELKLFKALNEKFGVLICFESIFPELARSYVRMGADFLVNVTNDGWFNTSPGPYQHFASSLFRAVENGVWVVRCANTGISAFISPYGEVVKKLPLNRRGILTFSLPCERIPTLYGMGGYMFPVFVFAGLCFYLAFRLES